MTRFKVFRADASGGGKGEQELERLLNTWIETLPKGTRIRRTQLSAGRYDVYALVNYELPEPYEIPPRPEPTG